MPTTATMPSSSVADSIDRDIHADEASEAGAFDLGAFLRPRRANRRAMLVVFRQLALLVETGIDVAEALRLAADTCKNDVLAECLEEIYDDITNGRSLSAAVMAQEDILGNRVTASIQAGEASGRLGSVLNQVAEQFEDELEMRGTISGSLAYPAILGLASVIVASVLIWFVLPQFEKSFASMVVDPPVFTKYLIYTSSLIRQNTLVILGVFAAAVTGLVVAIRQPATRRVLGNISFRSPILGTAMRNVAVGSLFLNMGQLLRNGISLLEAIQITKRGVSSGAMEDLMDTWENDVIEGRGLTHSLEEFTCFPEGADAMLVMAERTGKLEAVLTSAGSHYRNEGTIKLKQLLKLSEPIIIIVLGCFVGVVVASVLLPMLDVQSASQPV